MKILLSFILISLFSGEVFLLVGVKSDETCQKLTSTVVAYVSDIQIFFHEILFAKVFQSVLDVLWKIQYFEFFTRNL